MSVDPSAVPFSTGWSFEKVPTATETEGAPTEPYVAYSPPPLIAEATFETSEAEYSYTYTDETEYTEPVFDTEIKQELGVTNYSIDLPTDFQQIIKVIGILNGRVYVFKERGFGDREISTGESYGYTRSDSNNPHLFYVSREESKITFKSPLFGNGNKIDFEISYYAHLPQYDITQDLAEWDSLTVPLEPTYQNLINYYAIFKYNESWKDHEAAELYYKKYLQLREEYRESVDRKHQENLGTVAEKVVRFI